MKPDRMPGTQIESRHTIAGWRSMLMPLLLWTMVGLLLGALLGWAVGGARPSSFHAEAAISILPETSITSLALGEQRGAQDVTAFVQSELIVLNGRALTSQVQERLGLQDPPDVSSSQVGLTYVVIVAAEAESSAAAINVVSTLVDVYTAQRRGALAADLERAAVSVTGELDQLRGSLQSPALASVDTEGPPNQVIALQEEYGRLLAVNSALNLARGQLDRAVTIVQPPTIVSGSLLPTSAGFAIGGGLLGALGGLGAFQLRRRSGDRLRDPEDLARLGVPVLLPALSCARGRDLATAVAQVASEARLIAARVDSGVGPEPQEVVLFATSPGAGTSFVAAALATRLAERGPVLLVRLADLLTTPVGRTSSGLVNEKPGLLQLPAGRLTPALIESVIRPSKLGGVSVLTRGHGRGGASPLATLLDDGLLDAVTGCGRRVVVDAPALQQSAVAVELARRAGGGVLVVGRNRSRTLDVVLAQDIFATQNVRLIGVVFTSPRQRIRHADRLVHSAKTRQPRSWLTSAASGVPRPAVPGSQTRESSTPEAAAATSQVVTVASAPLPMTDPAEIPSGGLDAFANNRGQPNP